ncbi:MAG: hypothetical protein Barrevirus9_4 [Barrevirus sp.]|uniref:Uncharacterized protein n=1 Tax=Barrevirus sp. TaxID=2487763 RepID=A0A3G4ZQ74_9VIRU|nr:MAG: hypothetical protein Barrevirus9_4 [Barrevirus sp.]
MEASQQQSIKDSEVGYPDTITENGAPAFSTTNKYCLDFFASCIRDTPEDKIRNLITDSWSTDPRKTLAILLHLRDCRSSKGNKGGKGEKLLTYFGLIWLREFYPRTYLLNLPTFIEHGCLKDLCKLVELLHQKRCDKLGQGTWVELELMAEFVREDIKKINNHDDNSENKKIPVTLAGKWTPTESTHFDHRKNGNQAWLLAHILYPEKKGAMAMRQYRKDIGRLRENIKVVERLMSLSRFDEIEFATLPAKAHRLLRNAFNKRVPEKYNQYLELLSQGKTKINSTGTQPHELVNVYLTAGSTLDQTIEGQWTDLIKKLVSGQSLGSSLAISDVSGSMEGLPMQVSIAFGILLSQLQEEPFKNRLITFSEKPELHEVNGQTLFDKVKNVKNMAWGQNTNLLAVFKLIISFAKLNQVSQDKMIKTLFIFTDMQFDAAEPSNWKTTYQTIQDMYREANYLVPNIVFWNLRDTNASFPTKSDTEGVALVSGFSSDLLKVFLSGDLTDMTPEKVMNLTIDPYLELVIVDPLDLKKVDN